MGSLNFIYFLVFKVKWQTFCIKNYQKLATLFIILSNRMQQGFYIRNHCVLIDN